ncbi:MAG: nucleotidyl transferase AbiEii/AbiGii toxin family protein [Nanoarchaeota archaeon]|nr:nucleotidyl transferase AbiEii/AbiGii toxin family protein [Nanoarchaeota archaeon]MBU1269253.1 nucleotidyl transferase AbiEii/AbiGii toxin family protein [Nanoarchaeota archaeon]MBU1604789.1 nucleotidyl transferase AbiEii/AbiGii toxin family protein [Nanoarchaeota archaeon]
MITRKELIEISKKSDLNLYQQEKEYLLKLFLYNYYKKFEDAVFKGGTAIRFAKALNRFSEDLDFNITISPERFEKQIETVLSELRKAGIKNSFIKKEFFKDSFSCEIEFQGPLFEGTNQTRNKFRIDAGKRMDTLIMPKWEIIESEYPETKERFIIKMMDIKEMLCEKVIASFQRSKGRDVYDVWFLLNSGIELDKELLKKKLGKEKIRKEDFTAQNEYERDLKHLVPRLIPYLQVKEAIMSKIRIT